MKFVVFVELCWMEVRQKMNFQVHQVYILHILGDDCPVVWGKCTHPFHLACIEEWLKDNKTCPMCRQSFEFT